MPVTINGQGPFDFMVDTGANRSCISTQLAAKLGLPAGGKVVVNTITGGRTRQSVVVDRLQVGTRAQRRVRVPVLPFVGTTIEGLLAVDWLRGQRLVLDMANKQVSITASRRDVTAVGSVVVAARKRVGQLTIVDAAMGDKPISCMIDSGAQISIGNPILRSLLPPQASKKLEQVTMVSVTGKPSSATCCMCRSYGWGRAARQRARRVRRPAGVRALGLGMIRPWSWAWTCWPSSRRCPWISDAPR
uniref:Clan AA aspartic protease n=1 Tax=Phenylobacterium glaciei TaxID=2803784 RepID=A0A974P194_9CAUL|nr:clan AA aspartic protease [Phenylobacterium glaciei]